LHGRTWWKILSDVVSIPTAPARRLTGLSERTQSHGGVTARAPAAVELAEKRRLLLLMLLEIFSKGIELSQIGVRGRRRATQV